MLLEVSCVMNKWSTTYRQPVRCLAASAATTTLDVVAKKNSTNMLFMSTKPAAQKKTRPNSAD